MWAEVSPFYFLLEFNPLQKQILYIFHLLFPSSAMLLVPSRRRRLLGSLSLLSRQRSSKGSWTEKCAASEAAVFDYICKRLAHKVM